MCNGLVMPNDTSWITEALTNNTLVCVTDSSYNQKKALDVCTPGWIIYYMATKRSISATLIERSDSVSSYQCKLPGMLTIQPFLYVIEEYYGVTGANNILCADKRALYTF